MEYVTSEVTFYFVWFSQDAARQRLARETVVRIEEVLSLLDLGYFVVVRCEKTAEEPFFIGQVWHFLCKAIYKKKHTHILFIAEFTDYSYTFLGNCKQCWRTEDSTALVHTQKKLSTEEAAVPSMSIWRRLWSDCGQKPATWRDSGSIKPKGWHCCLQYDIFWLRWRAFKGSVMEA